MTNMSGLRRYKLLRLFLFISYQLTIFFFNFVFYVTQSLLLIKIFVVNSFYFFCMFVMTFFFWKALEGIQTYYILIITRKLPTFDVYE